MKLDEIKVGDWVTQYDSGYWQVVDVLPQYATYDYKDVNLKHKKGDLIGHLALLKKGFTSTKKFKMDFASCNIVWCKKVDKETTDFINSFFHDNLEEKKQFETAIYKERPTIMSIWLELERNEQVEEITKLLRKLPEKFNDSKWNKFLDKNKLRKMLIDNLSYARNKELVSVIYLKLFPWEFNKKNDSFLYFEPEIMLVDNIKKKNTTTEKNIKKPKDSIDELYEKVLKDDNPYLLKDIDYPEGYPVFKYFVNPLRTKSVIKSNVLCECCGKSKEYSYVAGMESEDIEIDVKNLCLDCIASGDAAKKFNGVFTPYSSIANRTADKNITEEIMYRTPSFATWQEKEWLSHCKTPCTYIGQVYIGDLLKIGIYKQVRTELSKTFYYQNMPMTVAEIDDMLINMVEDSSLEGHLFKCTQCGRYKLHIDLD